MANRVEDIVLEGSTSMATSLTNWAARAGWKRDREPSVDDKGVTKPGSPPDRGSFWNAVKGAIGTGFHTNIWLNEWSGRLMEDKQPADLDSLTLQLRLLLEGAYGNTERYLPHKTPVADAIQYLGEKQRYNPRTAQILSRPGESRAWPSAREHRHGNDSTDTHWIITPGRGRVVPDGPPALLALRENGMVRRSEIAV